MVNRLKSVIRLIAKFRKQIGSAEIDVYEPRKNVDESPIVLFHNQDEVERYKLEKEIRILETEIDEINKKLIPRQEEYRRKHRDLWNY